MDLEPKNDGRMHFSLGPIERWIVGVVAALVFWGSYEFWQGGNAADAKRDAQNAAVNQKLSELVTQQAVTNGQIQTLTTQLADVPRLTREMAEIKVRVERHEQDIRDIQRR